MSAGLSLKMFFFLKIVFSSSKKVFPYRYVPVETACSNHLKRTLQSSSQTRAILMVRTGNSAITLAFLFRKERTFRGFFWWISLDSHNFWLLSCSHFLIAPSPAANLSICKSSYYCYKLVSTFLLGFAWQLKSVCGIIFSSVYSGCPVHS